MDLLQTLLVSSQGAITDVRPAYTAIDLDRLGLTSSQPRLALPPSSQPPMASQDQMSSQGFSLTQSVPQEFGPSRMTERPPSCGQPERDENGMAYVGQQPSLSFRTISGHNGIQKMQNENQEPGYMEELRSCGNTRQTYNNVDEIRDDLSDISDSPNMESMEEWSKANPFIDKKSAMSATVPRSTGTWKTKVQQRCDQLGTRPEISYDEVSQQSFLATLKVGGQLFVNKDPQPSKGLAQEAVCELAFPQLPLVDQMEGIEGAGKKSKKRKSEDAGLKMPGVNERDRTEDWISLLNEHRQQTKSDPPQYEDFKTEGGYQHFSARLSISERPLQPFEAEGKLFATKKDARSAVAKAAVLWLRSEGMMSDPEKRRRRTSSEGSITGTGLTGIMEISPKEKSLPEQVHQLGMTLGLKVQPKWAISPSVLPSGQPLDNGSPFYDCHAEFDKRDTMVEERLRGRVGEVKHCLGQRKAKEACCELVMPILEEIKKRRLATI